jgi:hypothetical protein
MDKQEQIRITPEPPPQPSPTGGGGIRKPSSTGGGGMRSAPREPLPGSLPASERRQASPADRRFILLLGFFTIGSIALMMLIAFILLIVVK